MVLAAATTTLTITPVAIAAVVALVTVLGGLIKIVRSASRIESSVETQGQSLQRIEQRMGNQEAEVKALDRRVFVIETHVGVVPILPVAQGTPTTTTTTTTTPGKG